MYQSTEIKIPGLVASLTGRTMPKVVSPKHKRQHIHIFFQGMLHIETCGSFTKVMKDKAAAKDTLWMMTQVISIIASRVTDEQRTQVLLMVMQTIMTVKNNFVALQISTR